MITRQCTEYAAGVVVDETKKGRLDEALAIQAFARKLEFDGPFLFVPKKEETEATSETEDSQAKSRNKKTATQARKTDGACPCFDCATVEYLRDSQWKLRGSSWLMTFGPDRKMTKSWGVRSPHWFMDKGKLIYEEASGEFNEDMTVLTVEGEGTREIWNLVFLPNGRIAPKR